jgi:hypothetical protein
MFTNVRALVAAMALGVLVIAAHDAKAGSIAAGGWTATWPSHLDGVLELRQIPGESTDRVTLVYEKFADFQGGPDQFGQLPTYPISFQQTSTEAARYIAITDETVINNTGVDWTGFNFTILGGTNGAAISPSLSLDFSIDPFTRFNYSDDNKSLTVDGGVVRNGEPWFPGFESGALVIDAAPISSGATLQSFVLKEQPLTGGNGDNPVIPLPAGAWSGMIGLAGLGLYSLRHSLRRRFA